MKRLKTLLSDLLMPQIPTYIGIITRVAAVIAFQGIFRISPFNFRSRPNASVTDLIIIIPLVIGTYSLLISYAFQTVLRVGTVAETPKMPVYEKLIAIIVLAIVILFYIYICLTTPPGPPWYLE